MVLFAVLSLFVLFISGSLKPATAANVFVVDISKIEDSLNYDDYGSLYEVDHYDYDVIETPVEKTKKFRTLSYLLDEENEDTGVFRGSFCNRLFRTLYGKQSTYNCLQSLNDKTNTRHWNGENVNSLSIINDPKKKLLSRFSQDYFDIKDLGRSGTPKDRILGFSQDYYDVNDYGRSVSDAYCKGPGHGKYICSNRGSRRDTVSKQNTRFISESSDSSADENFRRGKVPNRFKVISNGLSSDDDKYTHKKRKSKKKYSDDNDDSADDVKYPYDNDFNNNAKNYDSDDEYSEAKKYSDDSDDNDQYEKLKSNHKKQKHTTKYSQAQRYSNEDSSNSDQESDIEDQNVISDDSLELSSQELKKKPKHKKYKNGDGDLYYIQGNKLYDLNEYRRQRLPYFLPKRIRWNQEDIHKLGYYWFNGPRS